MLVPALCWTHCCTLAPPSSTSCTVQVNVQLHCTRTLGTFTSTVHTYSTGYVLYNSEYTQPQREPQTAHCRPLHAARCTCTLQCTVQRLSMFRVSRSCAHGSFCRYYGIAKALLCSGATVCMSCSGARCICAAVEAQR